MNPVVRKLEIGAALSDADRRAIARLWAQERSFGAREDVIREGEAPEAVRVVLSGFACRYKLLPDGARQIVAWMIPGDWCDLHGMVPDRMDHGIATLSPCRIAYLPHAEVDAMISAPTGLARALRWSTLVDEAILREWIVGMGRRSADKQLAHLICELLFRLGAVGLVSEGSFDFPITQEELADTVGMSPVHVNRVLQHLRGDGLIRLRGKTMTVLDEKRLCELAGFNPGYLHLGGAHGAGRLHRSFAA